MIDGDWDIKPGPRGSVPFQPGFDIPSGIVGIAKSATVLGDIESVIPGIHTLSSKQFMNYHSVEFVREAVKAGKDVLALDKERTAPIHHAIINNGQFDAFKELCRIGKQSADDQYHQSILKWMLKGKC